MSIKRPFAAVPIQLGARYRAKARRQKRKRFVVPALVLTVAAIVGGLVGVLPSSMLCSLQPAYDQTVSGCAVTDGDTIRCVMAVSLAAPFRPAEKAAPAL